MVLKEIGKSNSLHECSYPAPGVAQISLMRIMLLDKDTGQKLVAEDEFLKNQVLCIREMAINADPFIKRRLLDLAKNDRRLSKARPPSKLPGVKFSQESDK